MSTQQPAIRELGAADALLRALLSAKFLANLPDAFLMRYDEKETGLSVCFDHTYAECRNLFRTTYGIASLTVGQVRELDLEVVPDEPHHANIKGVPYKEDDPVRAEWCASRLAERAVIVDRGKVRRRE